MENSTKIKKDVYAIATDKVIGYLEKRFVPWLTFWTEYGIPQNLITRQPFRGINVFLLASLYYAKNFFLTPKQLNEIGGSAKKDEKGHPVFYWKWKDKDENKSPDEGKGKPALRYYYVYNIYQCEGIKKRRIPKIERPRNPWEMGVAIVGNMHQRPTISHNSFPALYMPTLDRISIPEKGHFPSNERYYSELFRQLIRSTGHQSRLNRKDVVEATSSDSEFYSTESLIADIGASQLASLAGICYSLGKDTIPYRAAWIEKFKKDSHLIVYASTQAQRAVDFILNRMKEVQE